jgi:hypothetical protein
VSSGLVVEPGEKFSEGLTQAWLVGCLLSIQVAALHGLLNLLVMDDFQARIRKWLHRIFPSLKKNASFC